MSARRVRSALGACLVVVVVSSTLVSCTSIPSPQLGSPIPSGPPAVGPSPSGEIVAPAPSGQLDQPIQGASTYRAPDWVQPGTRMTYYGAAASVVQSYYTYVEDERGEWEDPKTGKRYHRTDEGREPQDMPTAAGEAYTQTDVLALEGNTVAMTTTLYSIDLLSRQFVINPIGGYSGPCAAVDGAWVHPSLLQDLLTTGYGDQMILRGPYALNGTTYDGVSFLSRAPGAYQDSTFDASSGALLATNTSVEGQGAPVHGPIDEPQGNVQLSYTRLVGVRQLDVPGIGAPVPEWVSRSSTLTYGGTVTIVNPMDPSGVFSYPMQATVTFGDVGQTWAKFTSHSVVDYGLYQQPADASGTTGATGVYWYDPFSLSTFQPGQVLDEDPITGARVTVESSDPGGLVSLLTEMNGASVRLGYDAASGVLVSMETTNATTGITVQLQLTQG